LWTFAFNKTFLNSRRSLTIDSLFLILIICKSSSTLSLHLLHGLLLLLFLLLLIFRALLYYQLGSVKILLLGSIYI
jgi:hypothetical protein